MMTFTQAFLAVSCQLIGVVIISGIIWALLPNKKGGA